MKTQKTYMKNKFHKGFYCLLFINLLSNTISFSQIVAPKFKSALEETWNNNAWENSYSITNTYDGNNHLTNSLTQGWENGAWVQAFQVNFDNNSNGTIHQSISQKWSTQWDNLQRTTYTYTGSNQELSTTTDIWFDPDWFPFSRTTKTYDGNNYLIKEVTETNNFVSWNNSSQIIYDNNTDGTVKTETTQDWIAPDWVNSEKTTYDYNASKKEKTATIQTWSAEAWLNSSLETNTYDANGDLTKTLSQQWDTTDNSWLNESQDLYTDYSNGNGYPHQITDQLWITDDTGSKWVNSYRITINYNLLGIRNFASEKNYTVYPNPAQDRINISSNNSIQGLNYFIFDQAGRKCINGTLNNNETAIDLNSLNSGIYFIQMGQNKNQTVKIIKE